MKTSNVLASVLFGSLAAAAPVNHKRALVTITSTLVQTEIVYTTVYAGDAAKATSSAAAFFEQSSKVAAPTTIKASSAAAPSSAKPTSVKPSSVAPVPTSVKTSASVAQPTSVKAPTSTAAPAKPTTTAAPVQPTTVAAPAKPTTSAAAAAPTTAPASGSGSTHSGGSMTLNNFAGALGSCGKPISDSDMTVALATDLYGASTYDVATGNPTNKWCNQKVAITYKGKTTNAVIMDRCEGCTNGGFDMTPALWQAVTGTSVGDRITGMTWTTI